jgi:Phage portal protein
MMPPGEAERLRMEQQLNTRQGGPNAGGVIVNNGSYDFNVLPQAPADQAGVVLAEYDRNVLAALFGVPPTYFTTETNLANLQAADAFFARFGVEPMCHSIASQFTTLVKQWDERMYFAHDDVLAEDEEVKEKVISMKLASGRCTINQVNEEDKYEPVAWGDEPLINKNMAPLSLIVKQAETSMKQAEAAVEQGDAVVKQADKGLEHDGKRVEIEAKKAAQKPAGPASAKRAALLERVERLRAEMREVET